MKLQPSSWEGGMAGMVRLEQVQVCCFPGFTQDPGIRQTSCLDRKLFPWGTVYVTVCKRFKIKNMYQLFFIHQKFYYKKKFWVFLDTISYQGL